MRLWRLWALKNYGGSKGTPLGSYRYYSVKSGDTISSIAQKNGITVSDVMSYNNLDARDSVYRGQVLKLPVTTENATSGIAASRVTINAKDANVKDVISGIAYNAGYTVIYKGSGAETITLALDDVSPLKAIDYVTRMVGLSYLKDGSTILVSTPADLNSTFVDSLVLTKFSFKYITYNELLAQASALGLTNISVVSQSNNQRDVWINAYPKEMAKLYELCKILDASENISVGSSSIAAAFTPIELQYISATEFSSLLASLGLHAGITMASRPMTLFVYVSGVALSDILTIKKVVDTSAAINTGALGGNSGNTGNNNGNTGDNNGSTDNNGGSSEPTTTPTPTLTPTPTPDDETPVEEPTVYKKLELKNISRSDAESLIGQYAPGVTTYGHERMTKSLWVFGTASAIATAESIISDIDSNVATAASTVHTYTAQNCTVDELMARLSNVSYEGAQFYTYDHSAITNSIIVYCDDVAWNNEIYDLLVALDTVDTGAKTWIPIESVTKETAEKAEKVARERIELMATLYPEVFSGVESRIVSIVLTEAEGETAGSYKAVTYMMTTSDRAKRMTNLLDALDNA